MRNSAIVPLATVADVSVTEGYSFVRREQLQRYAVIQMDVGGLITSTLLTLVLLPVIYEWIETR